MPNIKSQKKRVLISQEEKAQNTSIKSGVKTAMKKFELAVTEGRVADAEELFKKAVSLIDEAKSKGVYHINTASRKKARLAKLLDGIKASKAE